MSQSVSPSRPCENSKASDGYSVSRGHKENLKKLNLNQLKCLKFHFKQFKEMDSLILD